jgi:hypothetical protein
VNSSGILLGTSLASAFDRRLWRRIGSTDQTATYTRNEEMNGDGADSKRSAIRRADRRGKIKYGIIAWMLGLPLPIILIALFFGGCDF